MDLCTVSPAHCRTTSALCMKESHQDGAFPSPLTEQGGTVQLSGRLPWASVSP